MQTIRTRDVKQRALHAKRPPGEQPGSRYANLTAPAPNTVQGTARTTSTTPSRITPRVSKLLVGTADAATLAVALVAALALSRATGGVASREQERFTSLLALLSVPVWLLALVKVQAYKTRYITRRSQEFRRLLTAGALGSA